MIQIVLAYQAGDPSREKPYRLVHEFLSSFRWPLHVAGSDAVPFNVGHAKNAGVRDTARGVSRDVLLVADADCVTAPDSIRAAVWQAHLAPGMVGIGNELVVTTADDVARVETWEQAVVCGGEPRWTDITPQLFAIRRDAWDILGGYDESFVGYGFEDYDFRDRAAKHWPHRNVGGTLVHLWHEPDAEKVTAGSAVLAANRARYEVASGSTVGWEPV